MAEGVVQGWKGRGLPFNGLNRERKRGGEREGVRKKRKTKRDR